MSAWVGLVTPLVEVFGKLVADIAGQAAGGDIKTAKRRIDKFVALAESDLASDRAEAEKLMHDRLAKKRAEVKPPPSGGSQG